MVNTELKYEAERQAKFCSVFGNSKRVMILWALGDHELSVSEIAATVGTSLQNTSQHLHLMKKRNILQSRREGQTIFYRIAENELSQFCQLILQRKRSL